MQIDPASDQFMPSMRWMWRLPLVIGVLQVIFGIVVLVWPGITVATVAILIGINLVIGGVLRLVMAVVDDRVEGRILLALWSVLSVLAGIVIMRSPAQSVAVMVLVLGAFWVTWGLIEAVVALTPSARGARGPMLVEAALAVGAGGVLLLWPAPSLRVLVWIAGLGLVLIGTLVITAGWQVRGAVDAIEAELAG
jgi:uncharacterized membrane protein HdeD (DUF308 family)